MSSTGRGVANAAVTIVDSLGTVRKVNTNPLGFYSFSNVGTGETHTVRVTSKRFRFISQDVPVGDDNVANVDFMGIE